MKSHKSLGTSKISADCLCLMHYAIERERKTGRENELFCLVQIFHSLKGKGTLAGLCFGFRRDPHHLFCLDLELRFKICPKPGKA